MYKAALLYSRTLCHANPKWTINYKGEENIDSSKSYLIMMNHSSFYDIVVVNSLPINMRWIAKDELKKVPILGHILTLKGDIFVKRGNPESAQNMMIKSLGYLRSGISISIFPEGTRSKSGKVDDFKEGAFVIAKKARMPILPIVIKGAYETSQMPKYGQFSKSTFEVEILPEISVEMVRAMGIRELCEHTHNLILTKHKEAAPDLYK